MTDVLKTAMKNLSKSHENFNNLLDSVFTDIRELSDKKGGEYAGDDDRLSQFYSQGERLGLRPETIWAVYSAKHWDAIVQYVKDIQTGQTRDRMETIDGRIDDLILYLLLFKFMLQEKGEE